MGMDAARMGRLRSAGSARGCMASGMYASSHVGMGLIRGGSVISAGAMMATTFQGMDVPQTVLWNKDSKSIFNQMERSEFKRFVEMG